MERYGITQEEFDKICKMKDEYYITKTVSHSEWETVAILFADIILTTARKQDVMRERHLKKLREILAQS